MTRPSASPFRANKQRVQLVAFGAFASFLLLLAQARAQAGSGSPVAKSKAQASASQPHDTAACLDANERSITQENEGQQLAARESLRACAALACPGEIRQECERRLTQLNQVIPSVLFEFGDSQGRPVSAVQIRLDGELQATQGPQALIEANPGPHVFLFESPGHALVRSELVLKARQQRRVERVTFAEALPEADAARSTEQGFHGQRLAALILGGTSVVAAGFGTAFGLMAIHKDGEVDKACSAQLCDDPADTQKSETAVRQGNLSTAFFAVSAAAAVGGLALWFTAPKAESKEKRLEVGVGVGALRIRGAF